MLGLNKNVLVSSSIYMVPIFLKSSVVDKQMSVGLDMVCLRS